MIKNSLPKDGKAGKNKVCSWFFHLTGTIKIKNYEKIYLAFC